MSYIIEDNLNFYDLLNSNDDELIPNDDICLITNKKLNDNVIKLQCGHTFNYEPLYKEVICQKVRRSYLETTRLKDYQIKCPYCRTIQNKLLPYINLNGIKKIVGVNSPLHKTMATNNCKYVYKSGKRKGLPCDSLCYHTCCNRHTSKMANNNESKLSSKDNEDDDKDFYETIKMLDKHSQDLFLSNKSVKILRTISKKIAVSKYYRLRKDQLIHSIKEYILKKDNENK
jgi:hypothetical protein